MFSSASKRRYTWKESTRNVMRIAITETRSAAHTTLGLILQSFHSVKPAVRIEVAVDEVHTPLGSITLVLILPDIVCMHHQRNASD